MISEKFKNVPVEEDTKILSRKLEKIGAYEVLHEKWFWDGIQAESIIFANEDIEGLNEEEVKNLVGESKTTYEKGDLYTFVNFNFLVSG